MPSALLIIDVQSALFTNHPAPFEADAVLARINALTDLARAQQVPVVFIRHNAPGTALQLGSEGWQLHSALRTSATDHFVDKSTPDAFLRTELHALLQALGAEDLVVCGYASEFCVDTTVRSAAAKGYGVQLVADAHTTHDKPHASASTIRAHENATLPAITSFGVPIRAVACDAVTLSH